MNTKTEVKTEEHAPYNVHPVEQFVSTCEQARTRTEDALIEKAEKILLSRMKERGQAVTSPEQTRLYLRIQFADEWSEVFCALWMDNRNRVISFDRLFNGTIDGAAVYPREVVRAAIKHNAATVIFAHNHPSGVSEPSHADELITKRLKDALSLIDVRVLDHMVVGDTITSFAERGLL